MKDLLKKKLNKKGFTLAELLIVVAIIAVLVAIAIPVFTGSLNKAAIAADDANYRSALASVKFAELNAAAGGDMTLIGGPTVTGQYFLKDGTWGDGTKDTVVLAQGDGAGEISPDHDKGQALKVTISGTGTSTEYSLDWDTAPTT